MFAILRVVGAWRERRKVFAEMRGLLRDDRMTAIRRCSEGIQDIRTAIDHEDRREACRVWQQLRAVHPTLIREFKQALELLLEIGEYDEAEQLMEEGRKAHPGDPFYLEGWARIAQERRDYPAAAERWAVVRRKFSWSTLAYSRGARCLSLSGRFDEAEALMAKAIRRFPENIDCRVVHAHLALDKGNWETALQRFELLHTLNQPVPSAFGRGICLRKLGRSDEAEAIYLEASMNQAEPWKFLGEIAHIAEERGDWAEAARQWEIVKRRFWSRSFGYVQHARSLRLGGQLAAAVQVLAEAAERFPDDAVVAAEYEQAKRSAATLAAYNG